MSWGVQRPRTKAQREHWQEVTERAAVTYRGGRPRRRGPVSLASVEFGRGNHDGDRLDSIEGVANVRGKC